MGFKYVNSDDVAGNKKYITTSEPTRKCLVCERLENPNARIINMGAVWICDKCKSALQKIVESEDKE